MIEREVVFVGIDPGKQGVIAALPWAQRKAPYVAPVPVIKAKRPEYDIPIISEILENRLYSGRELFVTLELVGPMPPKMRGGSVAQYNRGLTRGWEWMLVALKIPYQLVTPPRWQSEMHKGTAAGDTKARSLLKAKQLFPGVSLRRSERARVDDHNVAEALLLAEYGRRTYNPQEER